MCNNNNCDQLWEMGPFGIISLFNCMYGVMYVDKNTVSTLCLCLILDSILSYYICIITLSYTARIWLEWSSAISGSGWSNFTLPHCWAPRGLLQWRVGHCVWWLFHVFRSRGHLSPAWLLGGISQLWNGWGFWNWVSGCGMYVQCSGASLERIHKCSLNLLE